MFSKENVILGLDANEKLDVLKVIARKSVELGISESQEGVLCDLLKREAESCTGMQDGIAIPHARSSAIMHPSIIFILLNSEISNWESLDGQPIKAVFALLASDKNNGSMDHLSMLSKIAVGLMNKENNEEIKNCQTVEEAEEIINKMIKEK